MKTLHLQRAKASFTFRGWVVTERDAHDDHESCERALKDYATSAGEAWRKFLKFNRPNVRSHWVKLNYVARPVQIVVTMEIHK